MNEWCRISHTSWENRNPSNIHYDLRIILALNKLKFPLRQNFIYQQSCIILTSQVYTILKENLKRFLNKIKRYWSGKKKKKVSILDIRDGMEHYSWLRKEMKVTPKEMCLIKTKQTNKQKETHCEPERVTGMTARVPKRQEEINGKWQVFFSFCTQN